MNMITECAHQNMELSDKSNKSFDIAKYDEYSQILADLEVMRKSLTTLVSAVKHLQKKNKKNKKQNNVKSGFIKPVKITPQLADIVDVQHDALIARSVVNKRINEYIKHHNLQVVENRQTFVLNEGLANLFGLDVGSVVHYFKMQTYLKHHYPKD
jgi:chromatin remodeling complex protein RSC6